MEEKNNLETNPDLAKPSNKSNRYSGNTINGRIYHQQGTFGESEGNQVDVEGLVL